MAWTVTHEEILARHAAFRKLCERVEAYRAAEPFEEWDNGLFRLDSPGSIVREIRDQEIDEEWGARWRPRARLIIERHGPDIHVCAVDHPGASAPLSRAG